MTGRHVHLATSRDVMLLYLTLHCVLFHPAYTRRITSAFHLLGVSLVLICGHDYYVKQNMFVRPSLLMHVHLSSFRYFVIIMPRWAEPRGIQ